MAESKNEILQKIKVFLGLAEMPSPAYTLADGTPIECSALEVGGTVMIGGAPAPAGDYTLSDGQTLSVDASGVITALNALPAEMEAPAAPGEAPVTQATIEQMVKEAVTAAVGAQMEKYTAKLAQQEKGFQLMITMMEDILKTSVAKTDPPKQTFTKTVPESKIEKFRKLSETLQIIKNN